MLTPSKEGLDTQPPRPRNLNHGAYELFWSRVPIIMIPFGVMLFSCCLYAPMWGVAISGITVLLLLAIAMKEFLEYR